MATKTRMPKKAKVKQDTNNESNKTSKTKASSSSPLSTLMMLGSQLLSSGRFNEGLPSFVTRGLDSEQIWQQLELRNEHKLSFPACTRELVRISSESQRKQKAKSRKNKKAPPQVKESVEGEESGLSSGSDSSAEDDILSSIKKRLAEEPSETGVDDGFDDEDDDSDEDDKLDFDFEVDNEIVRGLSDDENDTEEKDKGRSKSSNNKLAKPAQKRKTIVDDRFFKLSDMEQFLEEEDLKEEKKLRKEKLNRENDDEDDDDDDESDEEIDMFGEIESDSEKDPMYAEFFDPPDDESDLKKIKKNKQKDTITKDKLNKDQEEAEDDESGEEEEELDEEDEGSDENEEEDMNIDEKEDENQSEDMEDEESDEETKLKSGDDSTKKVSFSSDLLQSDEEEEEETNKKVKEDKSSFELKQEKLLAKAREMEELSLKEAPWELKGEASASKRPENSLLETVLDFQHTTRPAPVITEETTKTLEDYIKQRIKDKTFDDVERKEKPKEDVFEFKKRIVLDQEKSKLSLGQLYEQEFVKQQQQDKEEVKADPECEKIEKELGKLFHQLDALCNFKYTPMKPGTEVKILVNTPAITMEEVAPVATADADLLAPEEVLEKRKGELKAKDEKTATDKNRERRQKKKEKKERKKAKEAREKVVEKLKPGLGNKYSKAKALKQLEQISKSDKNVTLIKGDNKKMSSSTSFFTQLQEEVQTNNKAKKVTKEKTKKVLDANKLML